MQTDPTWLLWCKSSSCKSLLRSNKTVFLNPRYLQTQYCKLRINLFKLKVLDISVELLPPLDHISPDFLFFLNIKFPCLQDPQHHVCLADSISSMTKECQSSSTTWNSSTSRTSSMETEPTQPLFFLLEKVLEFGRIIDGFLLQRTNSCSHLLNSQNYSFFLLITVNQRIFLKLRFMYRKTLKTHKWNCRDFHFPWFEI